MPIAIAFPDVFISSPWNISNAQFVQSFDVSDQDDPSDIFFRSDGLKMYICGAIPGSIFEYNVSSAWDLSTAVFVQAENVNAEDAIPVGLSFKPDGLKMYFIGNSNDDIYEYNLSSAWNISTASFLQSFDISNETIGPASLAFKPDGTKTYVLDASNEEIHEYNVTAWNISTASFVQSFDISNEDTQANGIAFRPDGLKMYIIGSITEKVHEYNLSSAWNISTASFLQSFDGSALGTSSFSGLTFKPDGTKMFLALSGPDSEIQELNL